MIEGAYLSDAICIQQIQRGKLNVITAPTGCGKTYFATHELPKLSMRPEHVIYLIDTNAGKEQILRQNSNAQRYSWFWREGVADDLVFFEPGKITIMTYHTFGLIAHKKPEFLEKLELIICDEFHSVFWMSTSSGYEEYEQGASYALTEINRLIKLRSIYCVAFTATPSKVYERFKYWINEIIPTKPLRAFETQREIRYYNLESALSKIKKGKQYIVYIPRISMIKQYLSFLQAKGIYAQGLWSLNAKEHPMTPAQIALRSYLLEQQQLPPDLDVLILNRAYETSINIFGSIEAMYIHCSNADTITQVRGRYRGDLPELYIYSTEDAEIDLSPGYLNRPLFSDDKERLVLAIQMRNRNGRLCKWPTIKATLQKQGYTVLENRTANKRFSVIFAPPEDNNHHAFNP